MTLAQLKYIITVAEEGSISKAAQKLFVTQPSLTKQIHEVENEFNITIFNNTFIGPIENCNIKFIFNLMNLLC